MLLIAGSREVLFDLAIERADPSRIGKAARFRSATDLPPAPVVALYRDGAEPGEPPEIILCQDRDLTDFFAWTSTYIPQWFPLSSISLVLSRHDDTWLSLLRDPAGPPTRLFQLRREMAALAYAEALLEMRAAGRRGEPSLLAARSTFSYAAAQAICRYEQVRLSVILDRMEQVDRLLGTQPRTARYSAHLQIWEPISSYLRLAPQSIGSLGLRMTELADDTLTTSSIFESARHPGFRQVLSRLRAAQGRKEDDVEYLEQVVSTLRQGRASLGPTEAVSVALWMSELSTGPFSHWDTLATLVNWQPDVMMWYAVGSTAHSQRSGEAAVESILIRLADELRNEAARPADISWDELLVTATGGSITQDLRTGTSTLNVQLMPRVSVPVRAIAPRVEDQTRIAGPSTDLLLRAKALLRELDVLLGEQPENRLPRKKPSSPRKRKHK